MVGSQIVFYIFFNVITVVFRTYLYTFIQSKTLFKLNAKPCSTKIPFLTTIMSVHLTIRIHRQSPYTD